MPGTSRTFQPETHQIGDPHGVVHVIKVSFVPEQEMQELRSLLRASSSETVSVDPLGQWPTDLHRSLRLKRASCGQSHFGNFRQTISKGPLNPSGTGVVITENDLEQARCEQTA
jgi:hypothetical protein